MKITQISLTNFRSFQSAQTIELAPVTLLFGPNSVGKSSVLMALAYVQHILTKGHCNPQRLEALGDRQIGGFESLVHGKDLSRTITIKIQYEKQGEVGAEYADFRDFADQDESLSRELQEAGMDLSPASANADKIAVEFQIAWSQKRQDAYVASYKVWFDEVISLVATSDSGMKQPVIEAINFRSPVFLDDDTNEALKALAANDIDIIGSPEAGKLELDDDEKPKGREVYGSPFKWLFTEFEAENIDFSDTNFDFTDSRLAVPLSFKGFGALPILNTPLNLAQDLGEGVVSQVVREILSNALVAPLDNLASILRESITIGPIRVVPDSDYIPNPHPTQGDWIQGAAAWDVLYMNPASDDGITRTQQRTSEWFASVDKLDSGYEIVNQSIAEMNQIKLEGELNSLVSKRHVFFKELRTDILLSANELGTGISQVLPIIVAANYDDVGLVSVEQPELHIHPRFQVELADVFLNARNKHSFLIETHSEHLVLRLLRRIRQTTEDELPENQKPLGEAGILIVYLEPTEDGVSAKRIRVDEDGEFIDRWPHGFFCERAEELF